MESLKKSDGNTASISERKMPRFFYPFVLSAMGMILFLIFIPDVKIPQSRAQNMNPSVRMIEISQQNDSDSVGMDELSDFAPIFVPTKWNHSSSLPKSNGADTLNPNLNSPKYGAFSEDDFGAGYNDIERGKLGLAGSVMRGAYSGFGRENTQGLPDSGGVSFEIVNMKNGEIVASDSLRLKTKIFSRAEFIVTVGVDLSVATPILAETSGEVSTDATLSKAASKLLLHTPSGYYKIVFYP